MALVRSFQMLIPLVAPKMPTTSLLGAGNLASSLTEASAGGAWSTLSARTVIRNQFPRAKETKRVRVHGWWTRMATREGRRILMRRILKGRHVLSH
ncbi:39S ribosomal protein L34, mitochondrial-like [Uranotaenia lowii]|uniref:39S ribosomal protein L34, mitochondrial-like n=1 Tax=Uranotaenia lowii TaxID=190385 RepID=UPI00247A51FA|nr:39S ribosomal protein L34, mitochondrial-like [Uranotaenia lowii]